MKETEENDQRGKDTPVDPKTKDTGLKGDDAEMSNNSTAVVDDGDTETVDSKTKEFDDTDHEHDYRTPAGEENEVKINEQTDQDVKTGNNREDRNIDQNNTNNKGK